MIDRLVLVLLVGGCLVFGAILITEFAPAGPEDPVLAKAARSDAASPVTRPQNPRPEEQIATILARPLFNSTRRPPQDAPSGASADSDLTDARLTGIVTTPRHRMAIFAVSGDKPLRLAEGDAVSGWRIDSITPREVSLSGPSGTKTLQPKLDPNLTPPPGQPPIGQPGGRVPTPPAAKPRMPVPGAPAAAAQPPPGAPVAPPAALPRAARLRPQR